jgi:cytochrome c oxidase subunit 3
MKKNFSLFLNKKFFLALNGSTFFFKQINLFLNLFILVFQLNFLNIVPYHYFNDILYVKWPYYLGSSVFLLLCIFLFSFKQFSICTYLIFVLLIMLVFLLVGWFYDIIIESYMYGKYTVKLRQAINYGFILFLMSEIFLFFGFFWEYFDRIYDPIMLTGNTSLPDGTESMYKSIKPIFATFLLVASGFLVNQSLLTISKDWYETVSYFVGSIILGGLFLYIQYMEYTTLLYIIYENIFSSIFYMLTGFHGFHVVIGLFFLIIQLNRVYKCQFNRIRIQGIILADAYWHFVDYIWVFLYLSVYILTWSIMYRYTV